MKIGNAEVCDLCGASWTPHTDDCDYAGRQGPMVEMAVVAQSAPAQQLELIIHKDWSSANPVSKTASLSLPMSEPEEFDTDDAEAEWQTANTDREFYWYSWNGPALHKNIILDGEFYTFPVYPEVK